MAQLKAFVGHSFTEDDATVVGKFLEYLSQIQSLGVSFDWCHARAAEPRELAAKVLSLMQGKNLFIGICTKKEFAVNPASVQRPWFRKKLIYANESEFSAKTSDWIIQEIGFALGRGMSLILLIERGLRPPGVLQGNIEYIEFDRGAPETSYGRLLEMIHALLPSAVSSELAQPQSSSSDEEQKVVDDSPNWSVPKPEWKKREYEFALFHTIILEDAEGEKRISDAYLASAEGNIQKNKEAWEAYKEFNRLRFGKGGKVNRIEELARTYPENDEIHRYLGKSYEVFKEYGKAATCFQHAANVGAEPRAKARAIGDAAIAFLKAGQEDDVRNLTVELKQMLQKNDQVGEVVVSALRDLAELQNNSDFDLGLGELLLEMHPDDADVRFDVAYKYSQRDQDELSLFHYVRIPRGERSATALNNLGVQYEHFKLQHNSVIAYRQSEEQKGTLAMSNLANKLISVGYLKEAMEICERALKIEDYHKNVVSAIERIKELPSDEEKKEKELVEKAATYSKFYRRFGEALTKVDLSDDVGMWDGPKCRLRIEIKDGTFIAEGDYEVPSRGLIANALLGIAGTTRSSPTKRSIRYQGKVSGHAVLCVMRDGEAETTPSASRTLLGTENEIEALMVITESFSEIKVCERTQNGKIYTLTRSQVQPNESR